MSKKFRDSINNYIRKGIYPYDLTEEQWHELVFEYVDQCVFTRDSTETQVSIIYHPYLMSNYIDYRMKTRGVDNSDEYANKFAIEILDEMCMCTYRHIVYKIFAHVIELRDIPPGEMIID